MSELSDHDKWCRDQHEASIRAVSKIYTRLGIIETHVGEHSKCAAEVREELKTQNETLTALSDWMSKKDGATKALKWVAGIGIPTVLALLGLVWRMAN